MAETREKRHWHEAPKTCLGPGAFITNAGEISQSIQLIISPYKNRDFSFLTLFEVYVTKLIIGGDP